MSRAALAALAGVALGCTMELGPLPDAGQLGTGGGQGGGGTSAAGGGGGSVPSLPPALPATLDKAAAQARFATTTELMRYIVAPGCAAEVNECHNSEDFPDLSSEGNLWNLVGLDCNQNLGDRKGVEDHCEALGDELRIDSGANQGFTARVGSISIVTTAAGAFSYYEVKLDKAPGAAQTGGNFSFLRGGTKLAPLGGGTSLEAIVGQKAVRVRNAGHIPAPTSVLQGDENQNGTFGTGVGAIVKPGDAAHSYLVLRLLAQAARPRMPLGANADQPTEINRPLTQNEMYVLMSWINCMQPGDGAYSPIRYDCAANANNEGK
jgi:hypothetical protein